MGFPELLRISELTLRRQGSVSGHGNGEVVVSIFVFFSVHGHHCERLVRYMAPRLECTLRHRKINVPIVMFSPFGLIITYPRVDTASNTTVSDRNSSSCM